jgi:hypothetical protein
MGYSAKQFENQVYANLNEMGRLETELARMSPYDPLRGQKQRRLEMVKRATEQHQQAYTKLTGVRWDTVHLPEDRISPLGSMRGVRAMDPNRPNMETLQVSQDYKQDTNYIDNVVAGRYDTATGQFWVQHADGTWIELDYKRIRGDMAPSPGTVKFDVHHRDLTTGKIYPNLFDKSNAPNITAMVEEIETVRPNAELMLKLGQLLLEIPIITPTYGPGMGGLARVGKAAPKGSPGAIRRLLGIVGNPPAVRFGKFGGDDCLFAGVQNVGKKIVYQIDAIAATGAEAAKVKAAHREMLRSAAEEALRNGQSTFRVIGKQANHNAKRHLNSLAETVGVPGSGQSKGGVPPFNDYEVVLDARKVLASNQ